MLTWQTCNPIIRIEPTWDIPSNPRSRSWDWKKHKKIKRIIKSFLKKKTCVNFSYSWPESLDPKHPDVDQPTNTNNDPLLVPNELVTRSKTKALNELVLQVLVKA